MDTEPPVPLPVSPVLTPACRDTAPPSLVSPSPTTIEIAPPEPLVAEPDDMEIAPEVPLTDTPVLRETEPLTPSAPEFEVAREMLPLEVVVPEPL